MCIWNKQCIVTPQFYGGLRCQQSPPCPDLTVPHMRDSPHFVLLRVFQYWVQSNNNNGLTYFYVEYYHNARG